MSEQQIAASVRTLAGLLDVSEATIRVAINKQELPAYRVGRAIRVFVNDGEEWLRNQTRVGSEDDR